MAKKKISSSTATIREECDNIDEASDDVEDKNASTHGDPVASLW